MTNRPPGSGNIFGWRISAFGAVVIGLMLLLVYCRHRSLDVPSGFEDPLEAKRIQDSIKEYKLRETMRPPVRDTTDGN